MRRIAVVGAGQAGLQLALGLRPDKPEQPEEPERPDKPPEGPAEPYDVTLYAARRPEEVRAGHVLSTQVMFGPALALERAAGLNGWEARTPRMTAFRMAVPDAGATTPHAAAGTGTGTGTGSITVPLDAPAQSVDQRVKTAGWLELFEERGGRVVYGTVGPDDLPGIAAAHDLTVVATGHGPLAEVFARDERHSPYGRPQRTLAACYVRGTHDPGSPGSPAGVHGAPGAHGVHGIDGPPPGPHGRINPVEGTGEFYVLHGLTLDGPCEMLFWEAVPGGPFDVWGDRPGPDDFVERSLELLRTCLPGEYELCRGMEPTDGRAALTGAVTPVVRHPVARVAPDTYVLGMADAVVLNDPIGGQGANSAARCADRYLREITGHGEQPFDRTWMLRTFAAYWEHARHVTAFTNLLLGPPPEHVRRIMSAAARHPGVAHRYINGYADPAGFQDWFMEADRADAYLAALGMSPAAG
ncbi:styrene monooxygenase/indole monooxygenase family protein [Streptomyces sp. URMC 124]|uniref:styrene monooxygenase/indole monooxygenase family protein n=1 Tax=Streptomyces sp. URMC 124 TaxID=3423405 RepID=UPI003F1E2B3C